MDIDTIKKSMTNISPNKDQIKKIESLREHYKNLVDLVNVSCVDSRSKNIAMTDLENSLMWVVKCIVLE
jgi:hypothetical protein